MASPASPNASRRPTSRYGEANVPSALAPRKASGRVIAIVAVLLVALVIVSVARNISQRQERTITADFISLAAVDDNTTRMWIDVTRQNPDVPSYCIVTAVDYSHAEVGRREVILPAGGEELTRVEVELPVREPAVSGRVYGCSEELPFYMDPESTFYEAR